MAEVTVSKRLRVNVTRGVTGKYGWEATVDMEGATMGEVLAESAMLVAYLDALYPAQEGK